jgi:beta-glucanase (GH16 family)
MLRSLSSLTDSRRWLYGGAGLLLALATGCTKNPPTPTPAPVPPPTEVANAEAREFAQYTELVWSDEFDGTALDASKWAPEVRDVWFNNELQATTNSRDNINVTGGNLNIVARRQSYNGRDYTSGRIVTKGKKDFVFGRIDTRAKLPKGKGIWPAIWMLGSNDSTVPWPACGEIDIMELRGSTPKVNISTIHFGNTVADRRYIGTTYTLPGTGDFSDDFHTFSFIRSRDRMRWYVDGVLYYTLTSGDASPYPFNNPFYMILNVAVGGDFDGNPDASTTFPQQMQVDYVRYYQYR